MACHLHVVARLLQSAGETAAAAKSMENAFTRLLLDEEMQVGGVVGQGEGRWMGGKGEGERGGGGGFCVLRLLCQQFQSRIGVYNSGQLNGQISVLPLLQSAAFSEALACPCH